MRQRRLLELVKYYDFKILYHRGKVNVVANAMSRRRNGRVSALTIIGAPLQKGIINTGIELVIEGLANLTLQSSLLE